MTDLRAEATRIGYWNEGLAHYAKPDDELLRQFRALIDGLVRHGIMAPEREDAHRDDCD